MPEQYLTRLELYHALMEGMPVEFLDYDADIWETYDPTRYVPEYKGRSFRLKKVEHPKPRYEKAVGYVALAIWNNDPGMLQDGMFTSLEEMVSHYETDPHSAKLVGYLEKEYMKLVE